MKKILTIGLIIFSFLALASGCPGGEEAKTEITGPSQGLFWKLKTGKAEIYFLGSIHIVPQRIYPLRDEIYKAFDGSDNLVVEIDITAVDQESLAMDFASRGQYAQGDSIRNHITEKLANTIDEMLEEYGMSLDIFGNLKPWYLSQVITIMEIANMGYSTDLGIDLHFLNKANDGGKTILELETIEDQIDLLSGMPEDIQILQLEQLVHQMRYLRLQLNTMVNSWMAGKTDIIERMTSYDYMDNAEDYAPVYDAMFTNRNIKMAEKIAVMAEQGGTYFIIVGAGHYVGKNNVLQLLQEKGFSIEKL